MTIVYGDSDADGDGDTDGDCDGVADGDGDGDNDILYIFIFHCRQESKLLIRDIQQDDLGNYGCFAENEVQT